MQTQLLETKAASTHVTGRWRLSIGQILLWMTTTGAVLAMMQAINPYPESRHPMAFDRVSLVHWTTHRVFAPVYGAVLAGAAICSYRRIKGSEGYPNQPGHWLLVILAPATVALPIWISTRYISPSLEITSAVVAIVGMGAAAVVGAARQQGDENEAWRNEAWRRAFLVWPLAMGGMFCGLAMAAISPVMMVLSMAFLGLSYLGAMLSIFVALVAVLTDVVAGNRRDSLHWIGVGCLLLVLGHPIAVLLIEEAIGR